MPCWPNVQSGVGRPTLPETKDYQERMERIPSPDDVATGSYFLIASHNADFTDVDNQVSFAEVWQSDLAIVTRNHQGDGLIDGFVLNANRGDPIAGASVRVWRRDNQNRLTPLPSTKIGSQWTCSKSEEATIANCYSW